MAASSGRRSPTTSSAATPPSRSPPCRGADDPLDAAARAWLTRDEGWQAWSTRSPRPWRAEDVRDDHDRAELGRLTAHVAALQAELARSEPITAWRWTARAPTTRSCASGSARHAVPCVPPRARDEAVVARDEAVAAAEAVTRTAEADVRRLRAQLEEAEAGLAASAARRGPSATPPPSGHDCSSTRSSTPPPGCDASSASPRSTARRATPSRPPWPAPSLRPARAHLPRRPCSTSS